MRNLSKGALVVLSLMVAAGGAWAQMGRGHAPQIPGIFEPVVGSGAQYRVTAQGREPMDWAYAIVGKESVGGEEGYWMEQRMLSGQGAGMVMKELMVNASDGPQVKRMIMQMPGRPPMELPAGMMMRGHQPKPENNPKALGEKLGTETITVPAGTFVCEHYRSTANKQPSDIWISTKIHPYGLVKMSSKDVTMVLVKALTNQTSEIKGEPQKFQMPHF